MCVFCVEKGLNDFSNLLQIVFLATGNNEIQVRLLAVRGKPINFGAKWHNNIRGRGAENVAV